jgi:hypothetical protein
LAPGLRSSKARRGCSKCGYAGHLRRHGPYRLLWLIPIWAVPAGFLVSGYWPFGLMVALLLTVWLLSGRESACPRCGAKGS